MKQKSIPYASFSIWSEFIPAVGKEQLGCDMHRGFKRARKREPLISKLLEEESEPIRIGHWVQKAIYEICRSDRDFNSILENLTFRKWSENTVTQILSFEDETKTVRDRVTNILAKYRANPILNSYKLINISPGDEGIPPAIKLEYGGYEFNLFAPFDCLIQEAENTLHILDLKTGKSHFDLRQAYVYLLAAKNLYGDRNCVASFYNVETQTASQILTATDKQLLAIKIELAEIAKKHRQQVYSYWYYGIPFEAIYFPNPGYACGFCEFKSICKYFVTKQV